MHVPALSGRFPAADPRTVTGQRLILASVCLASLLGALDMSIVNIANPTIIQSFHVSVGMGSLVILAYMLTISTLILVMGKLGDRYGFRPLFITGLVVFGIGSFLCGIAPDICFLIGSRILQATGAAMFSAIGPAIITGFLPASTRGRSLGYLIALSAVGFALGPGIGGFITQYASWQWIFFLNLPVVGIALVLGWHALPRQQLPEQKPLRFSGMAVFILAMLCILLAFSLFQVPGTPDLTLLSLFVAGVLLGLCFWQLEKRSPAPLISPALLQDPDFRSGLAACFIVTVLFSGVTYLMPLYLLNSHHLDSFTAGIVMTVPALLSIIVAPLAGNLADRYGTKKISMLAVTLTAAGFLLFVTYNPTTILLVIIIGMLVTRVSTAAFFGPNGKLIMNHCPEGTVGNGSGVMMMIRYTGFVFGIVVFQSVFALRMYAAGIPRDGTPLVPRLTPELSGIGYQAVYLASFLLCLVALYILWRTKETPEST